MMRCVNGGWLNSNDKQLLEGFRYEYCMQDGVKGYPSFVRRTERRRVDSAYH